MPSSGLVSFSLIRPGADKGHKNPCNSHQQKTIQANELKNPNLRRQKTNSPQQNPTHHNIGGISLLFGI